MPQDDRATVAEPEDAAGSSPAGETRGGSTPPGGTMNATKDQARQAREHARELRELVLLEDANEGYRLMDARREAALNAGAEALEKMARRMDAAARLLAYAAKLGVVPGQKPQTATEAHLLDDPDFGVSVDILGFAHARTDTERAQAENAAIFRDGCRDAEKGNIVHTTSLITGEPIRVVFQPAEKERED